MDIQLIRSAETRYKKKLEDFFTDNFRSKGSLSHAIDHHQRVWAYAKELIIQSGNNSFIADKSFAEKLIIACYLHDSGMAVDPGPSHGIKSRLICLQFLKQNGIPEIEFAEVLAAVENHDNKVYSPSHQPDELLKILSVADDLDAFGFTGIFRYLEIYLTRGEPIRETGYLILENVKGRYNHFVNSFGHYRMLIEKHQSRYEIIGSFFDNYNKLCVDYQFNNQIYSGYCGVAEVIRDMSIHGLKPAGLFQYVREISDDKVLTWYFNGLARELSDL